MLCLNVNTVEFILILVEGDVVLNGQSLHLSLFLKIDILSLGHDGVVHSYLFDGARRFILT
jgi:hypothetical protein